MTIPPARLLEQILDLGLLSPEQSEAVRRLAADSPTLDRTKAELVRADWLTLFQWNKLCQRRGADLVMNQYVLLDKLGAGGLGEVFRARHRDMEREVALKRIRADMHDTPDLVDRFEREVKAAAKLSHENVVIVHDSGEADGKHYLIMELLHGTDLSKLIEVRGQLPVEEAIDYIRQACLGMQHAHERGIVHRDLKPANLMLTTQGRIKILDLGLALIADATRLTQSVVFGFGTPDYIAPEQVANARGVDIRADIYSLGCTLYHLLTGKAPFADAHPSARPGKHASEEEPPRVESLRGGIPPLVAECVRKMMAKKPEKRYQTPGKAAEALGILLRLHVAPPEPKAEESLSPLPETDLLAPAEAISHAPETVPPIAGQFEAARWRIEKLPPHLPHEFTNSIGMRFVLIPAGTFLMGSPEDEEGRFADETPHWVTLTKPFYLGAHPVTQKQYKEIMGTNPSWFSATGRGKDKVAGMDTSNFPVENVSREDVQAFLEKLNARVAEQEKGRVYLLPSEAQWEYACRGGVCSSTPYHFSDTISTDLVNYNGNLGRTSEVESYPANAFGLHDLHGNVWEWCADWYGKYPDGEAIDPSGPPEGFHRVLRGGSWGDSTRDCRSAYRFRFVPEDRSVNLGFRVALVPALEQ